MEKEGIIFSIILRKGYNYCYYYINNNVEYFYNERKYL